MDKSLLKTRIKKLLKEALTPDQVSKVEDKYNSIYSGMLKGNKKKLMKYVDPKFKRPNPDAMAMGRAINLVKKDTETESVDEGYLDQTLVGTVEPKDRGTEPYMAGDGSIIIQDKAKADEFFTMLQQAGIPIRKYPSGVMYIAHRDKEGNVVKGGREMAREIFNKFIMKESLNEDNSYIRVSKPRFVKDKNNPNFLNVWMDYETGAGSSIALGKETMSGQIRRESAAEAMKQMNDIANELEAKHNIEDIEVVDMENGKVRIFAVSDDFNDMVFESSNERLTSMVREVYSEKQRKWACAQDDPKFDEMCKDTAISKKKLKEERTSTVSKSRAKSELKQMLQGHRDDGMGKSTLTAVLAIDKDGKETKIKKLEDFSKFEKGTKFALKETTMDNDRLTELIKTALKGPVKEDGSQAMDTDSNVNTAVSQVLSILKHADIDGETMQHILEELGMDEQMWKQLNVTFGPGDKVELDESKLAEIGKRKWQGELLDKLKIYFKIAYETGIESLGSYDDFDEEFWNSNRDDILYKLHNLDESKDWIQKAIKRPGALHRELGVPKDKDIPKSLINKTLARLRKKDKDDEEEGTQLGAADERELKQLNLAKTLSKFNESKLAERVIAQLRK